MPKPTGRGQINISPPAPSRGRWASLIITFAVFVGLAAPATAADSAAGKAIFDGDCIECHTLRASETPKRGPHLENLFDRRYGAVEGFEYRMVWTKADPRWTRKHLDDYLVIHGRADEAGRQALIDYLMDATKP